jgi:hypothetical protein
MAKTRPPYLKSRGLVCSGDEHDGYLSPNDYERHAANPDAHQPAAVLAAVKDKPSRRPPSGAVLDRRCARRPHLRAGRVEEWLRRGPNKRMAPNRRAKCTQTRYPDP